MRKHWKSRTPKGIFQLVFEKDSCIGALKVDCVVIRVAHERDCDIRF